MARELVVRYLWTLAQWWFIILFFVVSNAGGIKSKSNAKLLFEISRELEEISEIGIGGIKFAEANHRDKRQVIEVQEKEFWHSYRFGTGTGNREVLRISGAYEEKWMGGGCNGDGVRSWYSLETARNQGLLLGLGEESLMLCSYCAPYLATNQRKEYPAYNATQASLTVSGFPTAAVMFQTWNDTSKTTDIIAVVALEFSTMPPMLVWYRVLQDNGKFVLLPTTWPLQRTVWHLLSFKIRKERIIVVLNDPRKDRTDTTVDLHGFTWEEEGKTDFWLIQKLIVDEASSIAVVNVEETAFLGISQPNKGVIMLYQFDFIQHKFVNFQEIEAAGVSNIVSFHVGFSAFMAVAGDQPMLLRYDNEEFIMEKIEGIERLGRVLSWLPVPIRTYRDEVVLLAETEAENKRLVSIVTWTGGHPGFSLHSSTTCYVNGESVEDLWCLLNYDGDKDSVRYGLQSAAALGVGHWTPGLIIPRSTGPSALFRLESYIEPVLSPVLKEVYQLTKRTKEMETVFNEQMETIQKAKDTIANSLNTQGSNKISGNWEFSELQGNIVEIPNISEDSGVQLPGSDDGLVQWKFGDIQWSLEDVLSTARESLDSLAKQLQEMESNIEDMKNELHDAVPLNWSADEPLVITAPKTFEGSIILDGKILADDLKLDWLNGIPVNEIFTDIVRLDQKRIIGGHKQLESLQVENIVVTDQLGGISVSSIVFSDDDITISGNLSYTNELLILGDVIIPEGGLVNGIDLSEEVITVNRTYELELDFIGTVTAENVLAEKLNNVDLNEEYLYSLFKENALGEQVVLSNLLLNSLEVLGENLEIKDINGQDFQSFLSSLVYTDKAKPIPGETDIKNCRAWSDVEIKSLNGLVFPDDFVRTSGDQVITGMKYFTNDVTGYSMKADILVLSGLLNEVNTSHLITLSTDQVFQETSLNFEKLEVTRLRVDGNMDGVPSTFYINPPKLDESPEVFTDIFFKDVEVTGDVIINGMIDGTSLKEIIGGVIYDDEEEIVINSPRFTIENLVAGSLTLEGLMNGLNVSEFLTTDTIQTLAGTKFIGKDCTISKVEIINGMINGVGILNFSDNAVKLSGGVLSMEEPEPDKVGQKIFGTIKFLEEVFVTPSLLASAVNGLFTTDVAFTNQDQEFYGEVVFESLQARTMELSGSLQTSGLISGVDLEDFDRNRFSLSNFQEIGENVSVHIHYAFIDGDLNVNSINDVLLESLDGSSLLAPEYDTRKSYDIENMIINGTIIAEKIGGFNIKEIIENAIWINRENIFEGPVTFEDEVAFENLQIEGTFNGYNLDSMLTDIVKQGKDVEITGHKTFVNGFKVGDMKVVNLNGNPMDDILTTNTEQEVLGPLIINGSVIAQGSLKLSSSSTVNGKDLSVYAERYEWRDGMHVLKGDLKLRNSISVDSLVVHGSVNNVNWEEFMNDIVHKTDDVEITGSITFNNKVIFKKDLNVFETVDGVNLELLFGPFGLAVLLDNQGSYNSNIEYEDGYPTLLFKDDVVIKGGLFVAGDVIADEVYGCSLKEWSEEAIYLNQYGESIGAKTFLSITSPSNVLTKSINGFDLNEVILLNGDQIIEQELKFKELYVLPGSDVYVANQVNGYNLKDEFDNTLQVEGEQLISGKKIFKNKVKVRGDVTVSEAINGIMIDNIATLDTDQVFRVQFKGNHIVAQADLKVVGSVNGRDLNEWMEHAVCKDGGMSRITGRWNVLGNVTFLGEDVPGSGTLDEVDLSLLYEITSLDSSTLSQLMDGMMKNLSDVCESMQELRNRVIMQPFLFRGLEAVQIIETEQDIQSFYHFRVLEEDYLTVSYADQCGSTLYVWDNMKTNFVLVGKLEVGPILEWHTLGFLDDDLVIVAKSGGSEDCVYPGYNLWQFVSQEQKVRHSQVLGDFKSIKVLPRADVKYNYLYTLGRKNAVTEWSLGSNGLLMESRTWNVSGEYLTLMQEKDWEVRVVSDDKKIMDLNGTVSSELPDIYSVGDYEILSISETLMLGVYPVNEEAAIEGTGDSIKVFNLNDGSFFTSIPAIKPSSVVAVNFGYRRQKMIAFLEDLVTLKMYEFKGAIGFVEYLSIPVRGFELLALPLKTRYLFNPHNFILVHSARTITVFEAEMYGDPVYGMQDFSCP